MPKKKDLKRTVEDGIVALLDSQEEPSDGRIKALMLGIKMCMLNAKLEESDYGEFFNPDDPGDAGSVQKLKGKESAARRRENGGDAE